MARIDVPDGDGHEMVRIWGRHLDLGMGLHAMSTAIYEKLSLPVREREVLRMRIAQLNECHL